MAKALSKSQIITEVAEKNGITKKQAGDILEHLAALAYKHARIDFGQTTTNCLDGRTQIG
jgi:DNA-binding protein HU-beta